LFRRQEGDVKEVWDAILKALPPDVIPLAALLAAAFFGIYYYKGLRNYTDALNDRWFLSVAVIVIALFVIYWIQKPRGTSVESGTTVALLVPRFEDDEGRQMENLFTQQVQAAVSALQPKAAVVQTDAYVRDKETAVLTMKARDALAMVFQPKVIRVKDKTLICFTVLLRDLQTTKPFPPVTAEMEKETLSELSSTIVASSITSGLQPREDFLLARLSSIEQRLDSMNSVLMRVAAANRGSEAKSYRNKKAVVVGINEYQPKALPRLAGATTDARSVAGYLNGAGFEVTLLLDREATFTKIKDALERTAATARSDDVTIFFYSGLSFRPADAMPATVSGSLILPTNDFGFEMPETTITLSGLVDRMAQIHGDKLVILDGCHGTFGIHRNLPGSGENPGTLQILSGTQDDEYASDTASGGIFTQALVTLLAAVSPGAPLSTSEILARVTPEVIRSSRDRQHPKLLTLAGAADVMIANPLNHGAKGATGIGPVTSDQHVDSDSHQNR
jgi:hypothetical protein